VNKAEVGCINQLARAHVDHPFISVTELDLQTVTVVGLHHFADLTQYLQPITHSIPLDTT